MISRRAFLRGLTASAAGLLVPSTKIIFDFGANAHKYKNVRIDTWGYRKESLSFDRWKGAGNFKGCPAMEYKWSDLASVVMANAPVYQEGDLLNLPDNLKPYEVDYTLDYDIDLEKLFT